MAELQKTDKLKEKAVLFGLSLSQKDDGYFSMKELERLSETANVEVLAKLFQKAKEITPATYIGTGKAEELKELVMSTGANIAICDNELSGSQVNNLSDILGVKVIDRTTLILDIFAKHATTNEGKLQVELAMLKYYLPRLSGIAGTSGRFGSGGVGMRGPGETKLELDKRKIRDQILKLEKEIEKIKQERDLRRKNRTNTGIKKVAIVGYTNAGKSTLMNVITKANIYADDKLFATLDTTTRQLWLAPKCEIVLTDTVGFINKLPHSFVDAFSATLEEVTYSDLILHVIDLTDKHLDIHKEVVLNELKNLNAINIPRITIYNKTDILTTEEKIRLRNSGLIEPDAIFISAKNNENTEILKNAILEKLFYKTSQNY
ncbi:MAG: GTPase HflX [Firmicutes bacterium]|nr:GTPase HflX [Bacillota bacterium]